MKYTRNMVSQHLLGILMIISIIAFALLIWRDFSSGLYEGWGHALAVALEGFENNLTGN
jgi:hypothetical protein